jgi:hypothetical protein
VQHINGNNRQVEIDLYLGRGVEAWERLSRYWPALSKSLLLRIQHLRIYSRHLRGRAALAAADALGTRAADRFLRWTMQDATRLEREQVPWAIALAHLLRAGVAAISQDASAATTELQLALAGLQEADMKLYEAATGWRLGQALGGAEGQKLLDQAEAWMKEQSISNPARMSALFVPGFAD